MSAWFLLVSMLAHSGPCEMINGDQITGADLARALPAFSSVPGDAVIGYSPVPGSRRAFTFPELDGIAKKYGIVAPASSKACFEWRVQPLNESAVRAAIRESLQAPEARVEVLAGELARFVEPEIRDGLVRRLKELGFRFVTLDLEGFRSGSLNQLVSVESRRLFESHA